MITCHFCKHEVKPSEYGVCQWTAGWVKLRAAGGGHGISLPDRRPHFAHGQCVERRVKGWDNRQMSLLEPPPTPQPAHQPDLTNAVFDGTMLVHACNVCGADASYGVGVAIKQGDLGMWYCREHRPWCEVVDLALRVP